MVPPLIRCLYAELSFKHFFDCYILLSIRWLCTTSNGYILLLASVNCDFVRNQEFPAIPRICGLKASFEFNINLLTLIRFWFFRSLMITSINFDWSFWKCCFIKNTQMLKMWNLLLLANGLQEKQVNQQNNQPLFSFKKTKLDYSNWPIRVHLSCLVNDGNNRKTYKTCSNWSIEREKTQTRTDGIVKSLISKEQKKLILLPLQFSNLK